MKGVIVQKYRQMSEDDKREFDKWLMANVAIASLFAAALFCMAVFSPGPIQSATTGAQTKDARRTEHPTRNARPPAPNHGDVVGSASRAARN